MSPTKEKSTSSIAPDALPGSQEFPWPIDCMAAREHWSPDGGMQMAKASAAKYVASPDLPRRDEAADQRHTLEENT